MQPVSKSDNRINDIFFYFQHMQLQEAPKPLSQIERVEAICGLYQQLIEVENLRNTHPIHLSGDEKWSLVRHVDGSVKTIMTKNYRFVSTYNLEDYEKDFENLMKQLVKLNDADFIESLKEKPEMLNKILSLSLKWSEMSLKSSEMLQKLFADLEQAKAEDANRDYKMTNANNK